jgi:rhodanese-related sulfurtransferase
MFNQISKISLLGAMCLASAVGCHSASSSSNGEAAQAVPAATVNTEAKAVPEVTVTQVASFTKDKSAAIFDANDADTRKEYGVVPGAVLLASHKDYPLSVLPPTKTDKLVFYCGGTQCRASDAAAARAASAGYSDVSVMRAGIRGWKEAGLPTSAAPQS